MFVRTSNDAADKTVVLVREYSKQQTSNKARLLNNEKCSWLTFLTANETQELICWNYMQEAVVAFLSASQSELNFKVFGQFKR